MGHDGTTIGDRFKGYEHAFRNYFPNRLPVIIRLDGKAFHTLTSRLCKPFDKQFSQLMVDVTKMLVEDVQTCEFGYVQSDEISLLLINYKELNSQPWFGNNQSKLESVTASMCTAYFNGMSSHEPYLDEMLPAWGMFDSRAFVLPEAEVCNYFIWRQQDATRNAIQSAAQSMFSHKSLQGLNCDQLQEKMFQEKQVNFNDYPVWQRRGTSIFKIEGLGTVDYDIPIFTQDREYVERFLP